MPTDGDDDAAIESQLGYGGDVRCCLQGFAGQIELDERTEKEERADRFGGEGHIAALLLARAEKGR